MLYLDDLLAEALTPATTAPLTTRQAAVLDHFRYGVNAHLHRYQGANYDKLIDAIDRLGVDIVRAGLDWNSLEPAEGTWKFDRMDKIVNDLGARGVEVR